MADVVLVVTTLSLVDVLAVDVLLFESGAFACTCDCDGVDVPAFPGVREVATDSVDALELRRDVTGDAGVERMGRAGGRAAVARPDCDVVLETGSESGRPNFAASGGFLKCARGMIYKGISRIICDARTLHSLPGLQSSVQTLHQLCQTAREVT